MTFGSKYKKREKKILYSLLEALSTETCIFSIAMINTYRSYSMPSRLSYRI